MPQQPLRATIIAQLLDDGVKLQEALRFPEVRCCATKSSGDGQLRSLVQRLAEGTAAVEWPHRAVAGIPELRTVSIQLDPPSKSAAWVEPMIIEFPVVAWRHGDEACVAYVPSLEIEVIASSSDELEKLIPQHIRFALQRAKATASLYRIALLRRGEEATIEQVDLLVDLKTPKQLAMEQSTEAASPEKKLLIERVGRILIAEKLPPAYEIEPLVSQIADVLAGRNPRSVLLVGPSGVGKTAAVQEVVRQSRSLQLGSTPFWSTSGARLVAGMGGFGMWQERCQGLCREASHHRAIVHLGSLMELAEVGRSEHIGQGIASFLRPYLARGELLAVAECTPEQLVLIERKNPHLLNFFQQIRVEEPSVDRGRMILLSHALATAKASVDETALETLDRLHRRYAGYSAYPGRPLKFLTNLLDDTQAGTSVGPAEVTAAFSRQTGLPLFILDDRVPLDLNQTRQWFAGRIVGQGEAVDLVVDLLATVKAALNRPRRPIASLLFIGPTGVGKTEMAKALAEFLFSDKARLTRFDMSEYGTEQDVHRLVGGSWQAEGLLTAKVREQPFSVVLLDEFEKAHPCFLDLLLQVLGEARLTDAAGRVADFSNAVVIMTSNLGAERFQSGTFGLSRTGQRDARAHFVEEVRAHLRPELFNRIDRIVPFLPLDKDAITRIARRELDLIAARDGLRLRDVHLEYAQDVVEYLATYGYDPLYGARPLKRLIERELLVPLSDGINGYTEKTRLVASVVLDAGKLQVSVRGRPEKHQAGQTPVSHWIELAGRAADVRRLLALLSQSPAWISVQNEIFALRRARERAIRRWEKLRKPPPLPSPLPPFERHSHERLTLLDGLAERLAQLQGRAIDVEDQILSIVHEPGTAAPPPLEAAIRGMQEETDRFLLELYATRYSQPDYALVAVWGDDAPSLLRLARAYLATASREAEVAVAWFSRHSAATLRRHRLERPEELLSDSMEGVLGVALAINDRFAQPRYEGESGTHTIEERGLTKHVLVEVSVESLTAYAPPQPIVQRKGLPPAADRRLYKMDQGSARDYELVRELHWSGRMFNDVIRDAMEQRLRMTARAEVEL